jgi:MinD-like ATPase involved in chromosome partitioning or flagellar assembly/tetratricopeptide (TPR) repeat protein
MKTNWITFYSYKGGVGRSMALANVAARLVKQGRRVVMIDFDLEAPGLDSFQEFSIKGAPGVVEYISDFLRQKADPPIEEYVHRCNIEVKPPGELWLMPSGRKDEAYTERLHLMDWSFLYKSGIAQPFIENWKKAIERAYRPDFVFIDSRTGLTDVGGVCTLHFPDIVVLIFALNRQNLSGIAGVRHAISQARPQDPIQIITVASPIPNLAREAGSPLDARLKEAQRLLGTNIDAVISYFSSIVLEETLWTLKSEFPLPKIVEDYRNLANKIKDRLHDGFDFLLNRAKEICETQNEQAAETVIEALKKRYGERSESFRTIARLERIRHDREASHAALEQALAIDPTDETTFKVVTTQYRALGRIPQLRSIVDRVYKNVAALDAKENSHLLSTIAERYMQLGEYKTALDIYSKCDEIGESDLDLQLVSRFNLAEARRRLTREIIPLDWLSVLEMLDINSAMIIDEQEAPAPDDFANRLQALHIALALTGGVNDAISYLRRAISIVETLNDTTDIFSVADYAELPASEFAKRTQQMLQALDRGELWDGMKLPPANSDPS